MLVRLALEEDREALRTLARMQVAETLPHLEFDDAKADRTFDTYLLKADPTFFVAEDRDGKLVGYLMGVICSYAFSTGFFCSQEVIYVQPDKRGSRAAAELIRSFNQWADRMDAKEVFTGIANGMTVERTTRFLTKFGFTPVGVYLRRIRHGKGRH